MEYLKDGNIHIKVSIFIISTLNTIGINKIEMENYNQYIIENVRR